jgi:hypothetical protein
VSTFIVVDDMTSSIVRWRKLDGRGLEVLRLYTGPGALVARSHVVEAGDVPFAVRYEWRLDSDWRTRSLHLTVYQESERELHIERTSDSRWSIDRSARPDLDECDEIDLAITPFCNTLALRRFGPPPGGAGELTTLYVGFPDLSISLSRQRYEQLDSHVFKYIDLGLYTGFEADLTVDEHGLVRHYPPLFERLESP